MDVVFSDERDSEGVVSVDDGRSRDADNASRGGREEEEGGDEARSAGGGETHLNEFLSGLTMDVFVDVEVCSE